MTTAIATLTTKLAQKLDMGDGGQDLVAALKATAFRGQVSDGQMTALLVVANQYGLNPWTRELFAFPDKNNGIVPVVSVDGWSRIINSQPQFDGIEFDQSDQECTCRIYRKDRSHPTVITEYMAECRRGTAPWGSHPRRMLRHKAMIQCARIAFGYGGIFDQDEGERIIDGEVVEVCATGPEQTNTQSRSQALKDRVKARQSAQGADTDGPGWTLQSMLEAFAGAGTMERLDELKDSARELYQGLDQGGKASLTLAIKARELELTEPASKAQPRDLIDIPQILKMIDIAEADELEDISTTIAEADDMAPSEVRELIGAIDRRKLDLQAVHE